jgi:O-antigen/teichoic acid export membrane protein
MPPSPTFADRSRGLLTWLERLTKTDLSYLAAGGIWLTIDEVAGGLAALLLSIAFAHFLPKDVYGTYRFFVALFWTLTAFTMTGLPTAVSRAVAKGHEGAFRASFGFSFRWALPLSAIALCASAYYFLHADLNLGYGLLIIAALGPLMQGAYMWGSYCIGKKDFRMLATGGALFAFFPAFVLLGTMYFVKSPLALLFAYLGGSVIIGFLIAVYLFKRYKPNNEPDPELQNLGWHFSAMNLLGTIAQQVDKLVVFHYLGAVELAVYSLATALPEQVKNVLNGVSTLALPKFVARPFSEIKENFWNRLWLFTGALVVAALVYMVIAPLAFNLLFPSYHEAIWYSQIYALSLIPIGSALPVTLLQAHKAKRELYIYNVLSPVFQIGALIILTSLYGLIGTVIARIAGRASGLLIGSILVTTYSRRLRREERTLAK